MLLLGAGSSVPLGIPGMVGFTTQFIDSIRTEDDSYNFIMDIKEGTTRSEKNIGITTSFDLEIFLSILTDLSGTSPEKPISIPTASFLIDKCVSIIQAREKYKNIASPLLTNLRYFIFTLCMEPIRKGEELSLIHI